MKFSQLTEAQCREIGLQHMIADPKRETLTFQFTNRKEVWTVAPEGYPTDGSLEVMHFEGRFYIPPPAGRPS
jgi:hypothetical protein